jgi:uncharacterized protein YjbI with pentapeptide repeats
MIDIVERFYRGSLFSLNLDTLEGADLRGLNFEMAYLVEANLQGANLQDANLRYADLLEANLRKANLRYATLSETSLEEADFGGADLSSAILNDCTLERTNFRNAVFRSTVFANLDLRGAIGLDEAIIVGPCTVGIDTICLSKGTIPLGFLQGVGIPADLIHYSQALIATPMEYFSCFICHAEKDQPFADALRAELIANNVRCWHYRYDLRGGAFWRKQIDDAIRAQDKLLLICSKESLERPNVMEEVLIAIEQERKLGKQKLFPIRLDDFVLSQEMTSLYERVPPRQRREDWLSYLRNYHISDFREWKTRLSYEREFQRLLSDLKSPPKR